MKELIKGQYHNLKDFLSNNETLRKAIYAQHRFLPMPLPVFDLMFRSSLGRRLFDFYGANVAKSSYLKRGDDQLSFWLSKEALYWHFWRQSDTHEEILKEVLSIGGVKDYFNDRKFIVVELGFGIGKNYNRFFRSSNLKKYIAVEPNTYLCNYIAKKFWADKRLEIINSTVANFINKVPPYDVLFCSGGVFMYLDAQTVDRLFNSLKNSGVKAVVVLNEGTPGEDSYRDDNTTMFNFKNRLISAGYSGEFIEKLKDGGIYSYFLMI